MMILFSWKCCLVSKNILFHESLVILNLREPKTKQHAQFFAIRFTK